MFQFQLHFLILDHISSGFGTMKRCSRWSPSLKVSRKVLCPLLRCGGQALKGKVCHVLKDRKLAFFKMDVFRKMFLRCVSKWAAFFTEDDVIACDHHIFLYQYPAKWCEYEPIIETSFKLTLAPFKWRLWTTGCEHTMWTGPEIDSFLKKNKWV